MAGELGNSEVDELEAMIDRSSVYAVLEAIAQICRLKAVHLRGDWQDDRAAKVWLRGAVVIEKASENKAIRDWL
jgi:hypothetical protein